MKGKEGNKILKDSRERRRRKKGKKKRRGREEHKWDKK